MNIEAVRKLEQEEAPPFLDSALDCFGWAPYDLDEFDRLLGIAARAATGNRFIDVGCGIGTKCLLAREHGLDVYGIDRIQGYVDRARELGVNAEVADVRGWPRYRDFDIVYVSHPMRPDPESVFEVWLHDQMSPGSVLVTLRGSVIPGNWTELLHESYQRPYNEPPRWRGVYVKGYQP